MNYAAFLFDIDGTLIVSGGAGQYAMGEVADAQTSPQDWKSTISFSGRTDRSIISDFFRLYGIEESDEAIGGFIDNYLGKLEQHLNERTGKVLPGVTQTLDCLMDQESALLGLLTGNIRRAAKLKLTRYELTKYFYEDGVTTGGFGDLHPERDDVARAALAEAKDKWGDRVAAEHTWVIGDTPNDVKCARAIGAKVVAVATGRYSLEELAATEPDFAVSDLAQADAWWDHLAEVYGINAPASLTD
ncbi:MAG: HAD hydrolase-like protein [Planctomycetota bacterium]